MIDFYYKVRIFLVVQKIRLYGWWYGLPSLKEYSWKQIACGAIAQKFRNDKENGIEPSIQNIKLLRDLEKEYNIQKSRI
jgi:hypothetical protein